MACSVKLQEVVGEGHLVLQAAAAEGVEGEEACQKRVLDLTRVVNMMHHGALNHVLRVGMMFPRP